MKLWLISQTENDHYDTFDSAIVAAESEAAAKAVHPESQWGNRTSAELWKPPRTTSTWASSPDLVTVALIGEAKENTTKGVILASYNAG